MNDLSQDAERVLASYQAARAPGGQREADARARLQRALATDRNPSGPVVTARFRRMREARIWFRTLRRAVFTGVAVFGFIWFLDHGMKDMSSSSMLEEAQERIDAKQYEDAFAMLAHHARQHPTRSKAEDRMGLVVDALCGMGMPNRARAELEKFLARVPESEHVSRRDDLCRGHKPPVTDATVVPVETRDNGRRTPDWMPRDEQFGTSVRE